MQSKKDIAIAHAMASMRSVYKTTRTLLLFGAHTLDVQRNIVNTASGIDTEDVRYSFKCCIRNRVR